MSRLEDARDDLAQTDFEIENYELEIRELEQRRRELIIELKELGDEDV